MAIAQDITRGVLGVPGMNYSLLLTRSIDFATYSAILYPAYPNELQRPLLLALIQMLWDRSDPNGYAHHITTDPLPNTPPHKVLLHDAFGDHQVANVATEVEARTIGASIHQPAIAPGRHSDVDAVLRHPGDPELSVRRLGAGRLGQRRGDAADHEHGAVDRRRSALRSAQLVDRRGSRSRSSCRRGGAVVDVCSGAPCVAP